MPTIADNIKSMAALVSEVKKENHLSEATVMHIVDMNFALAQANGQTTFSGDEDIEFPDSLPDGVTDNYTPPLGIPFPMSEDEIEATKADDSDEEPETIALTDHTTEGLN